MKKGFFFLVDGCFDLCATSRHFTVAQSSKNKIQTYSIDIVTDDNAKKVTVTADGKPFTQLIYTDTLEKHFLYPIYCTRWTDHHRGYPFAPRKNEARRSPPSCGLMAELLKV